MSLIQNLAANFLVIAPNIIVLDRICEDFEGLANFLMKTRSCLITAMKVATGRMIFN